jgi:hypothetical protein
MDLKISNTGKESRPISLTVDWKTEEYMGYRDYCFLRDPGAKGWRYISAEVKRLVRFSFPDLARESISVSTEVQLR